MKRLVLLSSAFALLAALVTTSALAKGASEATITGPGLEGAITLTGEGQMDGARLTQIAQDAGFFPSVFVTTPNPMLSERPAGELGPRYTITYAMPGPSGVAELRQDLYPYAQPSPVTRMQPGQRFFGTEKTVGGWYVAGTTLKDDLVAAGLPETSPVDGGGSEVPWTIVGVVLTVAACLAIAGVAVLRARRRPGPAIA
jgi:hypothetical protein